MSSTEGPLEPDPTHRPLPGIGAPDLIERVGQVLKEASATEIEPRWNELRDGDVRSKSPGELVTVADEEAEKQITRRLRELTPGVAVVGEEAAALDPDLTRKLGEDRAWLVDPVDGTTNFVNGGTDWSVMVALVVQGETCLSWIWRPLADRMYVAERGAGAECNGRVIRRAPAAANSESDLRGAVFTRFFDEEGARTIASNSGRFGSVVEGSCAGFDYPALVEGGRDFLLFWRTLPWDHAPGSLLVKESGAHVRRLDGSEYHPGQETFGLLSAADESTWHQALGLLNPRQ